MPTATDTPVAAPLDPKVEGQKLNGLDAQMHGPDSQLASQAASNLRDEYSKLMANLPADQASNKAMDSKTWGAFELTDRTKADLSAIAHEKGKTASSDNASSPAPAKASDHSGAGRTANTPSDKSSAPPPADTSTDASDDSDDSTNPDTSNTSPSADTSSPSGYDSVGPNGITTTIPTAGGGYVSDGPNGITTSTPTAGGGYVSDGPDGITTSTPTAGGGYVSVGPDGITTSIPTAGGGFVSVGPDGITTTQPTD